MKNKGLLAGFAGLLAAVVLLIGGFMSHTPVVENAFGALAGPDIPSPYLNWGGVRTYNAGISPTQATTTICAIQSPAATSTLTYASVKLDVSSSTATILDLAKGTTAFATTTAIGSTYAVAADAQAFVLASTSPGAGAVTVFAPNQWFVVGVRGGVTPGSNGAGFVPTGRCQATFVESPSF